MARRIEAGPIVVVLGAVLLLVSLFLEWFAPGASAWEVFEVLDLVLAAVGIAIAASALGLLLPEFAVLGRGWLAPLAIVALVVVASQIVEPPPAVVEGEPEAGAWLALAAGLLLAAGALLSFSRVRFAVTVEGRDPRRRQPAVVRDRDGAGGAAPAGPGSTVLQPEPVSPPTGAQPASSAPPRDG